MRNADFGLGIRLLVVTAAIILFMSMVALFSQSTVSTAKAASHDVEIRNFAFSPKSITIAPGDSVTWTNNDGVTHTVTADDGSWQSGGLADGQTYTRQFNTTGDFAYHCSVHPSMTGTVHVSSGSSPPPTPGTNNSGISSSTIIAIGVGIIVVVAVSVFVLMRRGKGKKTA